MEIGTLEPITDPPEKKKRRGGIVSGGSGRGKGGGDNGGGKNGGGGDGPHRPPVSGNDASDSPPDKSKVLTWFLLLVVLMTFGGLLGAYVVVATNGQAEWQPFNLPFQVWISTAILLGSSVTYYFAKRSIFSGDHNRGRNWLLATTALGAAFIASQLILWLALASQGLYMRGNPYAGFFYILTAIHAVHVLGGVIALGAIQLRAWYPSQDERELLRRRQLARSVGWYWHFMDILWIVLLAMLAFWQ